jgi:hypothetical protein
MHANPLSPSPTDEQPTREYRVAQWATGHSTVDLPRVVTVLGEKLILVSRELNWAEMSLLLTPARGRCQSCETNWRHMSYETLVQREATP